jgi:carnitine O-acetyltransferase
MKTACFLFFGPLVTNGYGSCYNLHADKMLISISAFKACEETSIEKFCEALEQSLYDMKKVLNNISLQNKI